MADVPSTSAIELAQAKRFANWVTTILVGLGLLFLVLFAWASSVTLAPNCPTPIPLSRVLGLGGILAGAAFTFGGLIGLLFGIPRPSESTPVKGQWVVNTNLIQISDWLTKVLVGVSLTTLFKVPSLLAQFGHSYGAELGSPSMAIGLLIHFFVSGFLSSYLMTRLVLQQAFHHADQFPEVATKTDPSGKPGGELTEPNDPPDPKKPAPPKSGGP